jgi:hypothetical protein
MRPLFLGKEAEVKTRLSQFGLLAIAAALIPDAASAAYVRRSPSIGRPPCRSPRVRCARNNWRRDSR